MAKSTAMVKAFPKEVAARRGNGKAGAKKKTHRAPGKPAEVTVEPFVLGPAGLVVSGNPTFEQWAAYFTKLTNIGNAAAFGLGDMLLYAENRQEWAEIWAQAIDETQKSVDSLQTFRNVAKKFDVDRRWPTLSFAHHREVAALPPLDQDKWLKLCDVEGLSVKQLRERMKGARDSESALPFADQPAPQVVGVVLVDGRVHSVWESEGLATRESARLKREGGVAEACAQAVRTKAEALVDDDAEGF